MNQPFGPQGKNLSHFWSHNGIGSKQDFLGFLFPVLMSFSTLDFPQGQYFTTSGERLQGLQTPGWQILEQEWCPQFNFPAQTAPHENSDTVAVFCVQGTVC